MSDRFTEGIRSLQAEEHSRLEEAFVAAKALFAQLSEEILVDTARRRAALMAEFFAATTAWPATTTVPERSVALPASTEPAPTPTPTPTPTGTPLQERRHSREVILHVLGAGKAVPNETLASAVMGEGWTRNAGDVVRRRMIDEGVVRRIGHGPDALYELVRPPSSDGASDP